MYRTVIEKITNLALDIDGKPKFFTHDRYIIIGGTHTFWMILVWHFFRFGVFEV